MGGARSAHPDQHPRGDVAGPLRRRRVGDRDDEDRLADRGRERGPDDGTARATEVVAGGEAALASIFDADGTAVIVHAQADDYRTDPSGNSGERVACGVLRRTG